MKYSHLFGAMLPTLALLFSACTFEQEDYFDESAALRIQHVNEDIKSKLVAGSSNGWLIQYYVAGTDDYSFEGFNLFGKFTDSGKVTLSSDHRFLRNGRAGQYTEYSSCYQMINEEGSVLAFDTWNDVLSVFVDPVDPGSAPNTLVNNGEGMNGDDRLVNLTYSDDEMLFRGERHGARARFIRLDCTPEEYIAKTAAVKNTIASEKVTEYKMTSPDTIVYISGLNKGYFDVVDRLDDPLQSSTHSCCFTPYGLRLQSPEVVGKDTVDVFEVNADTTALVCGNVVVTPFWMRGVSKKINSSKAQSITADGSCEAFAALFNQIATSINSSFKQTLKCVSFGRSSESGSKSRYGIVFVVYSSSKKEASSAFTAEFTTDVMGETATITVDANDYSNNFQGYVSKGLQAPFQELVSSMAGTYNLKVDNVFNPSSVLWTKVDDSSYYFKMTL